MKTLLRSTIIVRPEDDDELFLRNYQALKDSGLGFEVVEDNVLWTFITNFVQSHHHCPNQTTIRNHFDHVGETDVVDRLETLTSLTARTRGDFNKWLEEKAVDRKKRTVIEILKEAGRIVSTGIEIEEGREKRNLKGPVDAIRYLMDRGHDIIIPTTGQRLSGDVVHDGESFKADYERVEADPLAGIGQFAGIGQMDKAIRGAKRGELWTHAAFTGGLKSTLALNWAYYQAVYYKHSSLIFALEMPYIQDRNILYAIHTRHPKFRDIRDKLGIGPCLNYQCIRDGELDRREDGTMDPDRPEKTFLFEYVVPDFNDPANNYGSIHIEVMDPDKSDFTVLDLRSRAELVYSKDPGIRTIFVDHMGLMAPRKWVSSTTERLNEVIRDLKRLAMNFNRGLGIAVVGLFQISREGFKSAEKNDGRYNLTHLSYANEAERCVVSTCLIEEKFKGYIKVSEVEPGDLVWSSTGWRQVFNRFDNGVRRLWSITTDRGSVLETTALHRVRVVGDGQLGWKAVKDLTSEDFVAGSFGGDRWPTRWPTLPPLEFRRYEHRRDRAGDEVTAPKRLTTDLAYLLGAWDGDGKVHPDGLAFTGNRKEIEVRDDLRHRLSSTFSKTHTFCESPSRPGSFDIAKYSRPVKRWFEALAGSRGMEVPEVILRAPQRAVLAYLRGLFDTDGWVNKNGIVGINMKGASEEFLRDVQTLLTGMGIDSHLSTSNPLSKQTGKRYPKVLLRVRSRLGRATFALKIGFTDEVRQMRLRGFVEKGVAATRRGDVQVYPVPETFLRVYRLVHPPGTPQTRFKRSFYNLPSKVRKTGLVPIGAAIDLWLAAREDGIDNEDVAFLGELLQLQVMRVASVEDTGRDEPVVDLEVEGDHEYQTGPILSHNSSDIVTATFVNDDLRRRNLVRFQCLKSRDQKPFEDFYAGVLWACRSLYTVYDVNIDDVAEAGELIDSVLDDDE